MIALRRADCDACPLPIAAGEVSVVLIASQPNPLYLGAVADVLKGGRYFHAGCYHAAKRAARAAARREGEDA